MENFHNRFTRPKHDNTPFLAGDRPQIGPVAPDWLAKPHAFPHLTVSNRSSLAPHARTETMQLCGLPYSSRHP
ncbi:hypothetical protein RRSWK_06058 [Rhodopirellula sp. SWK7]|nr:hypothetical protein RRSWK_06058 [Rhodopirellula sp. SWK7]